MQICRHPLWSEISVLAGAKCQPAQTDGVKSRAEWLTLVASYSGWEGKARQRVFGFFVCISECCEFQSAQCFCLDGKVNSSQTSSLCKCFPALWDAANLSLWQKNVRHGCINGKVKALTVDKCNYFKGSLWHNLIPDCSYLRMNK